MKTGTFGGARARWAAVPAVALLALAVGVAPASAKKKKSKVAVASATVNQPIPDAPAQSGAIIPIVPGTPLRSTLTIGKKFKGKEVGSVAVTVQTTGSSEDSGSQLVADLIAPDGTTVEVFAGLQTRSIGPVTVQPNSPIGFCLPFTLPPNPPPPCPAETLPPPYAGTAGDPTLRLFSGLPMRGAWTLRMRDQIGPPIEGTSTLNSWSLRITPAKSSK